MYTENGKILLKKQHIKFLNKMHGILCSWIGRLNIVEIIALLKVTYRSITILSLVSVSFLIFCGNEKPIIKLT